MQPELLEPGHRGAVAVPTHHLTLLVAARMRDDDLEQEPIELCLGQRIGALLFDRVLGRDHHEIVAEPIVAPVNRDLALVHCLQQRGLRFGRRAVDLVSKQQFGEDRAFGEDECVGLEIEQVGAEHVAGHQVGRELDAAKVDREGRGKRLRQQRLAGAGHAFEQNVPAHQQAGEHEIDDVILTDQGLADFAANGLGQVVNLANLHQRSPVSSGKCRARAPPWTYMNFANHRPIRLPR